MSKTYTEIAIIKGDGIGIDVTDATLKVIESAQDVVGGFACSYKNIDAGAKYFVKHGVDIEAQGEEKAGECDAIFLGAIGLPNIRYQDGTEISPHLRLRDRYQLYAGVRPVKAYPNTPQKLRDERAKNIDMVILRESTEGLFYSAAVHGRSKVIPNKEIKDTLRISRVITEKLHTFGFKLAQKRKIQGGKGLLTCVDKANVFTSMAFFRQIFDEVKKNFPDINVGYNYVDAQALDFIRKPWEFDVLVMENMFGDILSDLAGGLVGGMGMAACGEIGDTIGMFQPAHGSAPDIINQDKANPLAAILSGALMFDYLGDKLNSDSLRKSGRLIEKAVNQGFVEKKINPIELGGTMGTQAITDEVIKQIYNIK